MVEKEELSTVQTEQALSIYRKNQKEANWLMYPEDIKRVVTEQEIRRKDCLRKLNTLKVHRRINEATIVRLKEENQMLEDMILLTQKEYGNLSDGISNIEKIWSGDDGIIDGDNRNP